LSNGNTRRSTDQFDKLIGLIQCGASNQLIDVFAKLRPFAHGQAGWVQSGGDLFQVSTELGSTIELFLESLEFWSALEATVGAGCNTRNTDIDTAIGCNQELCIHHQQGLQELFRRPQEFDLFLNQFFFKLDAIEPARNSKQRI
jgi:hypothetical protein